MVIPDEFELISIEGRTVFIRVVRDIAAVEERITEPRSEVFQGARSKIYLDD